MANFKSNMSKHLPDSDMMGKDANIFPLQDKCGVRLEYPPACTTKTRISPNFSPNSSSC